jgi:hypothetical protein
MTTALVMLSQPEPKWVSTDHDHFVGKDILELLSSSMYVDPMSMYREYIQNAADAVDLARSTGVLKARGSVEIRIDQHSRSVSIRDNGAGLAAGEFVDQLTALGGSKKRGTSLRGFRGVGRLAGLAFCQELVFRSKQADELTVHELRWDSREIRALLRLADRRQNLREVITRGVQRREMRPQSYPERFFEVELKGVVRHRDDRLLNEQAVNRYLAQVAPVAFHPDFDFASAIESFFHAHGVRFGVLDIELVGHGSILRPHRNVVPLGKSGETRFHELRTLITPGRNEGVAAVTWSLDHDYRGALPASSLIEGWRVRSGDIQVGDNTLLQSLFPESRFNAWCVAETHVIDPRILPNGRRDHFEQNAHYFDLMNHLAPQARDIAIRCRNSSIARNLVRTIDTRLIECVERIRIVEKGTLTEKSAAKIIRQLQQTLEHLRRLSAKNAITSERQRRYCVQIERLQKRLVGVAAEARRIDIIRTFPQSQRQVLGEVFAAIYQGEDNLQQAQALVDAIVSRLKRSRRGPRKRAKAAR